MTEELKIHCIQEGDRSKDEVHCEIYSPSSVEELQISIDQGRERLRKEEDLASNQNVAGVAQKYLSTGTKTVVTVTTAIKCSGDRTPQSQKKITPMIVRRTPYRIDHDFVCFKRLCMGRPSQVATLSFFMMRNCPADLGTMYFSVSSWR